MPLRARDFYQVMRLHGEVTEQLEECLRGEGITSGQYTVLSLLATMEPTSSADLARKLRITAQSMGQFVQALESKGLVERDSNPAHGRRIDIRRTARGRTVLARCDRLVDEAERQFFSPLSAGEHAQLREWMTRLRIARHAAHM
ncbi:MarR family winged helix-turn-helix transcriptional regulator [Pseudorhodoferax sp. Leaf274]|uniref:MarR family winged helix-turn-helix transcriptional regulator n=1 Tax=Pseudorhodoferax sp. Leaf274 TaxID=1736318 RepID=UPI00138F2C87|nr:MarR family transcriptional regulator [Pseudorhodoferax sp. Leaf274]